MPSNQWLTNEAQPIGAGWGGPPQLSAPNISGLVEAILRNKLARDKMTQENIADTIKNVRSERQSNEYLEAMKAAGLIPQDYEAGGLGGAKMGTGLAEMIQRKNEFEAREEHRRAMEARIGGRGGGGSAAIDADAEATGPEIIEKDGIKYEVKRTRNGIRYQRVPYQTPGGSQQIKPSPTERGNAAPMIPGLTVYPDQGAETLLPDIPSQEEAARPGAPPPADQNLAPGYGVPAETNKPVTAGEKIDAATVEQYILKAGGDRDKARQMAAADGWTF